LSTAHACWTRGDVRAAVELVLVLDARVDQLLHGALVCGEGERGEEKGKENHLIRLKNVRQNSSERIRHEFPMSHPAERGGEERKKRKTLIINADY